MLVGNVRWMRPPARPSRSVTAPVVLLLAILGAPLAAGAAASLELPTTPRNPSNGIRSGLAASWVHAGAPLQASFSHAAYPVHTDHAGRNVSDDVDADSCLGLLLWSGICMDLNYPNYTDADSYGGRVTDLHQPLPPYLRPTPAGEAHGLLLREPGLCAGCNEPGNDSVS
jgi:hypothetical protein